MSAPMKNSRQRNAILECVMSHHDHPTADIIYQELRESFPNISLGTVYRNLSLLTSLGKIMKITCENHADRFDGQTIPHAHFQCKSCGCLQDIHSNLLFIHKKTLEKASMESFLTIPLPSEDIVRIAPQNRNL